MSNYYVQCKVVQRQWIEKAIAVGKVLMSINLPKQIKRI